MENNMENKGLVVSSEEGLVGELTSRATMYCSLKSDTKKDKLLMFKAMNNPDKRLGDCINETIAVKDVFCEIVTLTREETGEVNECPRIVFIDEKGIGYQCVSMGIFSALKKMISIFGVPTWNDPINIKVRQITKGEKKILTFDIV